MDMVGIGTVATFLSMLFVSAFAVQAQSPPSEQTCPECPVSGDEANVSHSWDVAKRSGQDCMHSLRASYPQVVPSTVIG